MKRLTLLLLIFCTFILSAQKNIYSIKMSGFDIGKSTDIWTEYTDKNGRCVKKLDTRSVMDIKRGNINFKIASHTILGVLCNTYEPVFIKTETNQLGAKVVSKGFVKEGTFYSEITKNSNVEPNSYPLTKDVTFLTMIFKKYSEEDLLKGFSTEVISEDSLTIKNVNVSGKRNSDGTVTATVTYSGIPIKYTVKDHLVISSSVKNGLITYTLDGNKLAKKSILPKSGQKVDIMKKTSFKNKGLHIKKPRKTLKVSFSVKGKKIPEIVSNCYQAVNSSRGSESVAVDSRLTPCSGKTPDKNDITPNIYEDSNNKEIIKTAKNIAQGTSTDEQKAYKAVLFVYSHIKDKNYKHGNLSASEALKKRAGDCTEHSTLLAALLKAMKIPVRMVYGLVLDDNGTFFFHNWNEVYTEKGWVTVDSTFNQMRADSSRIVIAYGGNNSAAREETALAVMRFLNSVEISVSGYVYE